MKLYRVKVPEIAHAVIERLSVAGMLEVEPENKGEAEGDHGGVSAQGYGAP